MVPEHDEREVHREQHPDQDGQHQNVDDEHPREEDVAPGKRPVPDQLRQVRADERDREHHAVADRETHSREKVVDQRVAEVALE